MSVKDDGGPAFPVSLDCGSAGKQQFEGMTLRDYFAAKASEDDIRANAMFGELYAHPEDRCKARYRHADAMLAERAK